MTKSSEGVSILDGMVADTLSAVGEKPKRNLTPLAGERGADSPLPNDVGVFMSNETLILHAKNLRQFAAQAIAIADGIDLMAAGRFLPPSAEVDGPTERGIVQKVAEKSADEKAAKTKRAQVAEAMADVVVLNVSPMPEGGFPERFSALQAEAQAATLSQPVPEVMSGGWQCSVHPDATPLDDRSPKGRAFRRCTVEGCKQFER